MYCQFLYECQRNPNSPGLLTLLTLAERVNVQLIVPGMHTCLTGFDRSCIRKEVILPIENKHNENVW
jgi:hypothetical protein